MENLNQILQQAGVALPADQQKALEKAISQHENQLNLEIVRLNESLQQQEKNHRKAMEDQRFDSMVEMAVAGAAPRSAKAVRAMLNLDEVRKAEQPDRMLAQELQRLKEEEGYLFKSPVLPYAPAAGSAQTHRNKDPMAAVYEAAGVKNRAE